MIKLSDIFNISYGTKLDYNKMIIDPNGIPFVSRKSNNNGVVGRVREIEGKNPLKSGNITVSLGGSYILSSFIQTEKFYTGQNVAVLEAKEEFNLNLNQKLFICLCITENRFKYSAFGREANKTLKDIEIPSLEEFPSWTYDFKAESYKDIEEKFSNDESPKLDIIKWKNFKYNELFYLERGKGGSKKNAEIKVGKIPFVSATTENNGISCYTSIPSIYDGNMITIANNGNGVGTAFYQNKKFIANSDVTILKPKKTFKLNKYIAIFVITLIQLEKYKYNYGRKWTIDRMKNSVIKLPIDASENIDYEFMENYIKSLKYSKGL